MCVHIYVCDNTGVVSINSEAQGAHWMPGHILIFIVSFPPIIHNFNKIQKF